MSAKSTNAPATDAPAAVITDESRVLAELKADPKNARRHSEGQVAQIARSIESFGYVNKVVIRPDGQIIAGHATTLALQRIGRTEADCRVVNGLTESQYRKLGIALNRIPENSAWDNDVLAEVMGELDEAGEDLTETGFSSGQIEKLLKGDDALEVQEIETGPIDDEFWISIRGPLADQAKALKAVQDAIRPFAAVSVDLGTINLG